MYVVHTYKCVYVYDSSCLFYGLLDRGITGIPVRNI